MKFFLKEMVERLFWEIQDVILRHGSISSRSFFVSGTTCSYRPIKAPNFLRLEETAPSPFSSPRRIQNPQLRLRNLACSSSSYSDLKNVSLSLSSCGMEK